MNTNSSVESIASQIDFSRNTAARRIPHEASSPEAVFGTKTASEHEVVTGSDTVEIGGQVARLMRGNNTSQTGSGEQSGANKRTDKSERIAQRLEKTLNAVNGTQVKFQVRNGIEGESAFNFAVIDKETGEVVREFPPHEIVEAAQRAQAGYDGQGVFVDESA